MGEIQNMTDTIAFQPTSLRERRPLFGIQQNQLPSPASIKPDKMAQFDRIHKKLTGQSIDPATTTLPECATPERKKNREEPLEGLQAQVEEIKATRSETAIKEQPP